MLHTIRTHPRRLVTTSRHAGLWRVGLMVLAIVSGWLLLALSPAPSHAAGYTLHVSFSANRASPTPLAGAVVSGPIFVFTSPDTSVARVRFFLDDPGMAKKPRQTESNAPFDFAGGSVALANPFDTDKISTGDHTITAALDLSNGTTEVVSATFRVEPKRLVIGPTPILLVTAPGEKATLQVNLNSVGGTARFTVADDAQWLSVTSSADTTPATLTLTADAADVQPGTYTATVTASADDFEPASESVSLNVEANGSYALLLSARADRANPGSLEAAAVAGNIYVFLGPESGVRRVRFFLDDPQMTKTPYRTENGAPYDFAGGGVETASPFDTTSIPDGVHIITAAVDLSAGGTEVVSNTFTVANGSAPPPSGESPPPPPPSTGSTVVSIQGHRFYINGSITYPGTPAAGLLMNVRMVNSTYEDPVKRPEFDPEANTDRFLAAMPDYVAHGIRAFTLNLQGGNPGYEGAVNTAFNSNGSLKPAYLARVKRVIQQADALGAVVILGLYYQRQDQHLSNESAVKTGVVNVMKWLTSEGFSNVLVEIANEYRHSGYDHAVIKTNSGMVSLIDLARATAPHLLISASGVGDGSIASDVARASDYILIHTNSISSDSNLGPKIDALKSYGKPIVINEDRPEASTKANRASIAVQHGASWGLFLRSNQEYPFAFWGAEDDPTTYQALWHLTH